MSNTTVDQINHTLIVNTPTLYDFTEESILLFHLGEITLPTLQNPLCRVIYHKIKMDSVEYSLTI